jgi:hypothetical protein
MRLLLSAACILCVAPSLLAQIGGSGQRSAKVLFYDPTSGDPTFAAAPPLAATGLTPVGTFGVSFVGVQYWFENDQGVRFAAAGDAGEGAHVRMHVRGNVTAWLTVWLSDAENASVELTPRSDSGPEHRWTGYRLPRDQDYVDPREFVVAQRNQGAHILLLLARSQSEQVDSAASCRAKIQRIAAAVSAPGLVGEVDRTTPGRIGTYVVRLENSQTGAEVVIGR